MIGELFVLLRLLVAPNSDIVEHANDAHVASTLFPNEWLV
jgi:hypothetical protein